MTSLNHPSNSGLGACEPNEERGLRRGWSGLTINTGRLDRSLRGLGAILLIFGAWFTPILGSDIIIRVLLTGFACLNLFAASTGWCAMYCATGRSTVRRPSEPNGACGRA